MDGLIGCDVVSVYLEPDVFIVCCLSKHPKQLKEKEPLFAITHIRNTSSATTLRPPPPPSSFPQLLALGAQLDARSVEGSTALHVAAKSGRKEVVQILNLARADLGATDWRGKTPLHHVCEYPRENDDARKMAEGLLHRGADVNISDACGYTPLMLAMENLPLMRMLVALGTKPSKDQAAFYVEHCRGDKRREEVLDLLVAEGWCPRFFSTRGDVSDDAASSAAVAATAARATARCGPLLQKLDAPGDAGETSHGDDHSGTPQPLGSTSRLLSARLSLSEGDNDLLNSSSFSETTNADHLARAPIANVASQAHAAPDIAAETEHAPTASTLRERRAFTDLRDCRGFTALDIAVVKGCHEAAVALLELGASPTPPGVSGKTSVHLACEHNAPEMVKLLLRFGALAGHCWNDLFQSPLMVGCFVGALDAVKVLLPHLSVRQINSRDKIISAGKGGTTALLAAITCGKNEIGLVEAVSCSNCLRNVVGLCLTHTLPVSMRRALATEHYRLVVVIVSHMVKA